MNHLSRRDFLGLGAAAAAAALIPSKAFAGSATRSGRTLAAERSLSFVHTHTGERLSTQYCAASCMAAVTSGASNAPETRVEVPFALMIVRTPIVS